MTRAEQLVNDLTSNPEGSDSDGRIIQLLEDTLVQDKSANPESDPVGRLRGVPSYN